MFQRTLGKQLLLATLTVVAATAGQVTIGKTLASGVRIDAHTGLTCSNVLCEAMAGQAFTFTSLMSGAGSASLAASLGLPAESYVQMTNLSGLNLTPAEATFTPASDSSQAEDAGSFEMSNGQITAIDVPESPDSKSPRPTSFSDPVVSMSFNANSTSIMSDAVTQPAPSPSITVIQPAASIVNVPAPSVTANDVQLSTTNTQMGSLSMPEPGTEMLIGIGLVAAGAFARIKRNASSKS